MDMIKKREREREREREKKKKYILIIYRNKFNKNMCFIF